MKQYMKLHEYVITEQYGVPFHVCENLVDHHLLPMNHIRNTSFKHPIIVSKKSGYRHPKYEESKGRSLSTHEFMKDVDREDNGWGAADYTVQGVLFPQFIRIMIKQSPYTRICFYPEAKMPFIHCDYRFKNRGEKFYYVSMEGKWVLGSVNDLIKSVDNRFEGKAINR